MTECEFRGASLNNGTPIREAGRESRSTGTGLNTSAQRMPRCALLQDLGYKVQEALCLLVEKSQKDCPVAKYYLREITAEEANQELRSFGISFLTLKEDPQIK